jgi:hypothetical protein
VPFAIERHEADGSPFSIVLQMHNSGPELAVLIWQLDLELRPRASAIGNIQFSDVFPPPMSLFGEVPGPISDLAVPSIRVIVFDGDPGGGGQSILAGEARNIVGLQIAPEPGANGAFQLITPVFNPAFPTAGSTFLPADPPGPPEPKAIDNDSPSDFGGYILLGTITLSEVPEPAAVPQLLVGAIIVACLTGTRIRLTSSKKFYPDVRVPLPTGD